MQNLLNFLIQKAAIHTYGCGICNIEVKEFQGFKDFSASDLLELKKLAEEALIERRMG